LLFRKRQCIFIAFDLLYLNGKDLRVSAAARTEGDAEETAAAKALTNPLTGSRRNGRLSVVRVDREDGSGRDCVQAQGLAVQGDGEAVALLDQGEELARFAGGGAGGVVRARARCDDRRPFDVDVDVNRCARQIVFVHESTNGVATS